MSLVMGNATKGFLGDELDYLIERVRKVQRGQEKGVDAKPKPLSAALKKLTEAKALLDASLVASPE